MVKRNRFISSAQKIIGVKRRRYLHEIEQTLQEGEYQMSKTNTRMKDNTLRNWNEGNVSRSKIYYIGCFEVSGLVEMTQQRYANA